MHKNIDLVTNPIKSFWKLTIPIMCFVMFDGISALVDMMWVSSISSDAVVASNSTFNLFYWGCNW